MSIRKANNQGLVITTAGPDLIHDMPTANPTTVKVKKIMWSNNTGANGTLIFGTQNNAAGWVPLFPTITCINGFDGELNEWEVPNVEFVVDARAAALGRTGDIMVQVAPAGAIGIIVRLEVEETREG